MTARLKLNSGRLVTDGSRIYFGEGTLGSYRIMQVAATGGPTAIIPTRLANFQFTALSQDGSYLLGARRRRVRASFVDDTIACGRTAPPRIDRGSGRRLIPGWAHSLLHWKRPLHRRERRLQTAQTAERRRSHCESRAFLRTESGWSSRSIPDGARSRLTRPGQTAQISTPS